MLEPLSGSAAHSIGQRVSHAKPHSRRHRQSAGHRTCRRPARPAVRGPISSIQCRSPLPGARKLLAWLTEIRSPWAIATSGRIETAAANLAMLNVDPCKRCDNRAGSGQARKAGSGSVSGRSRPSRCPHRKGDCGRGQYLRYARGNALPGVGDRTTQRRIQFR